MSSDIRSVPDPKIMHLYHAVRSRILEAKVTLVQGRRETGSP